MHACVCIDMIHTRTLYLHAYICMYGYIYIYIYIYIYSHCTTSISVLVYCFLVTAILTYIKYNTHTRSFNTYCALLLILYTVFLYHVIYILIISHACMHANYDACMYRGQYSKYPGAVTCTPCDRGEYIYIYIYTSIYIYIYTLYIYIYTLYIYKYTCIYIYSMYI